MKRRFILSTGTITAAEEQELILLLGTPYWWHWLPNTWLLIDFTGSVTVHSINAAFNKAAPSAQCLVQEVDVKAWNTMEIPTVNGVLSDWIKNSWMPS